MTEKTLTQKGSRIRRRMIDTTARILREQGFRGATVRRIAGEAHVNISSVRYYFGSKEQLIALAMDTLMGDVESVVSCLDDTRLPAEERLRRYMRAYIPLARKHPALFKTLSCPLRRRTTPIFSTSPFSTSSAGRNSPPPWRRPTASPTGRTWSSKACSSSPRWNFRSCWS